MLTKGKRSGEGVGEWERGRGVKREGDMYTGRHRELEESVKREGCT